MIKNVFLYLLLIQIITSCNNNRSDNDVSNLESTKFTREDSSSIFSVSVTNWLNNTLKTSALERKITLEERWEDDSLQLEPFAPEQDFYKIYSSVLHWSSDSAYILDVGSYGMVPVAAKDGSTKLEAGEPDTEIALIDVKNNQRIRLMYVGSSSTILSGRWLDNNNALLLGTFINNNRTTDTLMWFIDVKENLFRLYNVTSK